ncbi:MAG TPA: hypothetical protein VEK15_22870 [Vicinamibacteria bacterium]|nr:hypothetical protein [Vicinamibacteria bacterium]
MTPRRFELHKRLQLAGALIAGGLLVEVITIYWSHPLAFVAFLLLGGALVGVGALLYLYSIVST